MKKLLRILVLGLLWCNVGVSGENKFKVKELKINLSNKYELQKIGTNVGQVHGFPYEFVLYAQVKEGKLISLLETFNLDLQSNHKQLFLDWSKQVLSTGDSNSGCNKSRTKEYFKAYNKPANGHCVSVKILNSEEIYSPNYNDVPRINMKPRTRILKEFIEENNLKVQDQMLRSEHFFWKNKTKLIYVFLTDLTSENLKSEQIQNFIINAIDMHKGFENDLKLKPKMKLDFAELPTAEEIETKAEEKPKITKKKIAQTKGKKKPKNKRETIEQMYVDGLLTRSECIKAKKKTYSSESIAVAGCKKTKKLVAQADADENNLMLRKEQKETGENVEGESFKLGICPEAQLVRMNSAAEGYFHKVYKNKSLSKIKKKLKCEPIIVYRDTTYDFYKAIISNRYISQGSYGQDPLDLFIDKKKFSKLKREYLTTDVAENKTQITQVDAEEAEGESFKIGICPKSHSATLFLFHNVYKNKSLSKIKKKLRCDLGAEPIIVDKDISYDFYNAVSSKLVTDMSKNNKKDSAYQLLKRDTSSFWIHKEKFSKFKKEYLPLKSKTQIAQADAEEKPKNNLKTKEDLEAFMIGKEIEMDGVVDGKNYTWSNKYHSDGVTYQYSQGMEVEMIWEAVNGNTFKQAMVGNVDRYGWNTYVLDYDNLTYLATRSKDPFNQGKYFKGNILSPEFPKKLKKKKKSVAEKKIEEEKKKIAQKKAKAEERKKLAKLKIEEEKKKLEQIKADAEERERVEKIKIEEEKKRIAQINAEEELENKKLILSNKKKTGTKKINKNKSKSKNFLEALAKKEVLEDNRKKIIRYECQQPWDLTTEDYRPLLDIYELDLKDRILKGTHRYITDQEYTDERIYPILASDKDRVLVRYDSPNGNFSTKFFFNYGTDQSIVAADNSYKTQSKCVNRDYFVDIKIADKKIDDKTISKENLKALELAEKEAILAQKEIEEIEKEQKQLLAKQNEILKNQKQKTETAKVVKLKIYDDPKKLTASLSSSISQSQFHKYNATSVVSYLFFESSENYLISLELLYRAYDQNAEADKIRSHVVYMKESKSSEKNRLNSTRQIVESQSAVIINNIQDEGLKLSEQGKLYYAQSLPYALNAAIATYNLYYAATNTVKNVGASGDIVFGILNNLNNVIGIAQILPQLPAYSKNMYKTTKLIISGAKTRKIKDSTNVNKALDELNLDT